MLKIDDVEYSDIDEIEWGVDFTEMTSKDIDTGSRWTNVCTQVFKHVKTDRFFRLNWLEPATEMQDADPGFKAVEVYPRETTAIVYSTEK